MKNSMHVKTRTLVLAAVICLVLIAAVAGAAAAVAGYTVNVQHTANGVQAITPTFTFSVFEQDGVTPVSAIQWGNVTIGTPVVHHLVIKNTGNQTITVSLDTSAVPAGWTLSFPPVVGLTAGSQVAVDVTISTTSTGSVNFPAPFVQS